MELEEMKNAWTSLDEKWNRKEKMDAILIREMYRGKVRKSMNKILRYDILGVVGALIALPYIAWVLTRSTNTLIWTTLIYWSLYAVVGSSWSIKKIACLLKLDETASIKSNTKIINTYAIWIKKEKPIYIFFAIIGVIPILIHYWLHASLWWWVFLIAILSYTVFSFILTYKRLYDQNIRMIQHNLRELEELEEK